MLDGDETSNPYRRMYNTDAAKRLEALRKERHKKEAFLQGLERMKKLAKTSAEDEVWYELDAQQREVRIQIKALRHKTVLLGGTLSDTEEDLKALM